MVNLGLTCDLTTGLPLLQPASAAASSTSLVAIDARRRMNEHKKQRSQSQIDGRTERDIWADRGTNREGDRMMEDGRTETTELN